MTKQEEPIKIPFLNVCATVNFTAAGLAQMAGVSPWAIYAMLSQQPVDREKALKVLVVLNEYRPFAAIMYSLENVDIVLKSEQPEEDSSSEQLL